MDAHPEDRVPVLDWLARFRADPDHPDLGGLDWPDIHGQQLRQYTVPGVSLVIIVSLNRYPDVNGVRWARVIFPRSPDDIVPDR